MKEKVIDIIEQAKHGDETAYLNLYEYFYPKAYGNALRYCRCEADAKDVCQETFLKVRKNLSNLRQNESFPYWMSQIVLNEVRRFYNVQNKTVTFENEDLVQIIHQQKHIPKQAESTKITDKDVFYGLIDQIPKKQGDMLKLVYIQQLTTKEVARKLGIAEGTVKSRVFQAKKSLKKEVEAFEKFEGRKLSIQVDALLAVSTLGILSKLKALCLQGGSANLIAASTGVVMLVTGSIVGLNYYEQQQRQEIPTTVINQLQKTTFQPVQYNEKHVTSAKGAYFLLKQWAPDAQHIESKTPEEKQAIMSVYLEFIDSNSPYIELLHQEQWIDAFMKI